MQKDFHNDGNMLIKKQMNTFIHSDHIKKNLSSKYVENLDIKNRNAHSIIRQLRHRLWTVNCRGNSTIEKN